MNRIAMPIALSLALSSLCAVAQAQTNTDPNQQVNRIGAKPQSGEEKPGGTEPGETETTDPLPQFSGNLPSTINEDRTYGVNAAGTMIGPQPENGQPDPRFPGDKSTGGGGQEINGMSTSAGAAQTQTGADKMSGQGQVGGQTSNLNEGLPSASMDNSGANSGGASGGTGGGAGGTETNSGGDAAPGKGASQSIEGSSNVAAETRGAAPYAIGAGVVILGGFLFGVLRSRNRRRNGG